MEIAIHLWAASEIFQKNKETNKDTTKEYVKRNVEGIPDIIACEISE